MCVADMATDQQAVYAVHSRKLHRAAPTGWPDCSDEAVQARTFAVAIGAAGAIGERRCFDTGGGAAISRTCLHGLGMHFQQDHRLVPSFASRWVTEEVLRDLENRLVITIKMHDAPTIASGSASQSDARPRHSVPRSVESTARVDGSQGGA